MDARQLAMQLLQTAPGLQQQQPSGIDVQTKQRIAQELEDNKIKTLKAAQSKAINNMLEQGASEEDVLNTPVIRSNAPQQVIQQAAAKAQQPQMQIQNPKGILSKLFGAGGVNTDEQGNLTYYKPGVFGGSTVAQDIGALQGMQQFAGLTPMQKGEREKLQIMQEGALEQQMLKGQQDTMLKGAELAHKNREKRIDEYFKLQEQANKGLSAEQAKLKGGLEVGMKQLKAIREDIKKGGDYQGWVLPGDQGRKLMKTYNENLTDLIGRLRSGGAINADEEKRFKGLVPKIGATRFLGGEGKEVAEKKLNALEDMFDITLSGLTEGVDAAKAELTAVDEYLDAGYSLEDIMALRRAKGGL